MTTTKQLSLVLKKSTITKLSENAGKKGGAKAITDSELTHGGGRSCRPTV